jgi:hypothetical protein
LVPLLIGALVLGAIVVVSVVATGGGDDDTTSKTTAENATYVEPVGAVTPAAFTGSIGSVPEKAITGAPSLPSTQVTGSTVGLYGGSGDAKVCDAEKLVGYLLANGDKARAFAGALGITAAEIPTYVRSLTPVLLTRDTRVTNHGYANGVATPRQSVLQAGTAVLVDRYGVPRVKCGCGNPLTPPSTQALPTRTIGTPWAGYDRTTVIVVVQSSQPVDSLVLVNTTGDGYLRITVGSSGAITTLSAQEYCAVNPTDPTCVSTTTTTTPPPATAPPAPAPGNTPIDAVAQWVAGQGFSYAGDCSSTDSSAVGSLCSTLVSDQGTQRVYAVGYVASEYGVQVVVTLVNGQWTVTEVHDIDTSVG